MDVINPEVPVGSASSKAAEPVSIRFIVDTSMQQGLVFFISSFVTLDGILPLAWGASRRKDIDLVLVFTEGLLEELAARPEAQRDTRIRFLKALPGVRLVNLSDYLPQEEIPPEEMLSVAFQKIVASLPDAGKRSRCLFSTSISAIEIYFAAAARALGLPCMLLADSMFPVHSSNRRVLHNSAEPVKCNLTPYDFPLFQRIFLPQVNAAEWIGPIFPASRITLTGNPRYCAEWLELWRGYCGTESPQKRGKSLSVTLLLRPHTYAVYWKEIVRTVQMLVKLHDAACTIQIHAADWSLSVEELGARYPWLFEIAEHVVIQPGSAPTVSSIARAGLVIDTGTSAAFEALALGVPLVQFKYLQAYKTLLSEVMPSLSLKCRDDLVLLLRKGLPVTVPVPDAEFESLRQNVFTVQSIDTYVEALLSVEAS